MPPIKARVTRPATCATRRMCRRTCVGFGAKLLSSVTILSLLPAWVLQVDVANVVCARKPEAAVRRTAVVHDRIRTRAFTGVCTSVFQAECVPDFVHEVVFAATRGQPVVVAVVVVLVDQRGIEPVIDPHRARVVAGDRPTPTTVGA